MSGSPVVNRSTKPPPEVDRNSKPGPPKDHSYCNMPPPVNRGTKPRQPPPGMNSYENYPSKNRTLERVRSLSINAPHQNSHTASPSPDDDSYCQMEPVRSESTRCYSFSKKPVDVGYEEMAPMPVNRNSTSSSSSCCEEDEETYTSMFPPDPRLSSHMVMLSVSAVTSEGKRLEYQVVGSVRLGKFRVGLTPWWAVRSSILLIQNYQNAPWLLGQETAWIIQSSFHPALKIAVWDFWFTICLILIKIWHNPGWLGFKQLTSEG